MSRYFLYSYPRSGNTWLRYIIEKLTEYRTKGYNSNVGFEQGILKKTGSDKIVHKRHGLPSDERIGKGINDTKDKLILIVRDYKNVIVRHNINKISNIDNIFYSQTTGNNTNGLDYIYLLKMYQQWNESNRFLIYYEDLLKGDEKLNSIIKSLCSFLESEDCDCIVDDFINEYDFHKKQSINIYNTTEQSLSKENTQHKDQISKEMLTKWQDHIVNDFPSIHEDFLRVYDE
jgi:hypothetical protein